VAINPDQYTGLRNNGWSGDSSVTEEIVRFQKSVETYPNIKPGEDFKGYPTKK
jgi:hypothetical protein